MIVRTSDVQQIALCDENWRNGIGKGDQGVREQEDIGKVQSA